ncbi:MAG: fibrobacter succinogenes major paralogous domain-containing protein [Bacteroidetes bacterium]|nr:fibrobacter succinogenes major paralogous domain-containing protein [Bacteroidota bacterium]
MKSTYRISIQVAIALFILFSLAIIYSCQKREWENPYDENASPSDWAPYDLQIIDISLSEKMLTWNCNETHIDGFIFDRKVGNDLWQLKYKIIPVGTFETTDNDIIPDPDITYQYRIYAFAGMKHSDAAEISKTFSISPITNLHVELISLTEIHLTWQDGTTGEDGFKIDRKVGNLAWETAYATINENVTGFTDNNFPLNNTIYYKVYAYVDTAHSGFSQSEINTQIPAPDNLNLTQVNWQEISLTWSDHSQGEDGFKIDRKLGNSSWEAAYGTVNENVTLFTDSGDFNNGDNVYYRIYAFFDIYNSTFTENNIQIFICGHNYTDLRDNKLYSTTLIGTQCWMAENLNYQTSNSWCYDNNASNCDTYGRLYNWGALMNGSSSSNAVPSGVKGICPEDWHIPSDEEWKILEGSVDSQYYVGDPVWNNDGCRGSDAGKKLKSSTGWNSGGNGTNDYGFSALPGGYRGSNWNFYSIGAEDYFWSSAGSDAFNAWGRGLTFDNNGVYRNDYNKVAGLSVRCLRD